MKPARTIDSPYLTSQETLIYLRLNSLSNLYRLVREHHLPCLRRGNSYLFDKRELDAWVRGTNALDLARQRRSA